MADNTDELVGRSVARVGFGAMQLERLHDTPDAAIAVLEHAVGLGVNHIDTAQFTEKVDASGNRQRAKSVLDSGPAIERSMQLCEQQGIGWVPFFPLGSAFPGIAKVTEAAEVIDAAAHADVAPAQVALAWLLAQSSHTLLIPGTADVAHLESNMAVSSLDLSETVIAQLGAIGKSTVDAPITPPGWPGAE